MAPRGEGSARGSVGRSIRVGRPIYTGYIYFARGGKYVDGAGHNVCRGERVFEGGGANVSARYESLSWSVGGYIYICARARACVWMSGEREVEYG